MKDVSGRTKAASVNALTILVTQLISLLLRFGVQTTFIHELSQDYLGLNGLFANVISFLNFADLGIGTAITVALYRPIADHDIGKIQVLIDFYRKSYIAIIAIVSIIGICVSPWIYLFIKKPVFSNWELMIWFLLYLSSTLATYFSAHKRSFLIAIQQEYLNSLNDFVFKIIQQILQIIILVFWHSFLGFLTIQMVTAIVSNWQLSRMVNKRYPYIFNSINLENMNGLTLDTLREIKRNVIGAISSKIGTIIVFGTDNIILSMFIGLSAVAKYSNYMLIVQSVSSIFSQVIGSSVSSIGNLHVTSSKNKQKIILYRLLYLNTLINLFVSAGLSFAVSRFITLWAGNDYLLPTSITIGIVLNYSITQSRYAVQCFISGMGLYWSIRWKSIIEAVANLSISLLFVQCFHLGIMGVILGTLGSNILVNLIWEPYIVFHDGALGSMRVYFFKYVFYEAFIIVSVVGMTIMSSVITKSSFIILILSTIVVEVVTVVSFIMCTLKLSECQYFLRLLLKFFKKIKFN